jgi:hypothetical protein
MTIKELIEELGQAEINTSVIKNALPEIKEKTKCPAAKKKCSQPNVNCIDYIEW